MKGIQYELDTYKLKTTHMKIDPKKLKQVMFLLLYNALKHTTLGRIKIVASDAISNTKKYLKIQFFDSGCGIKESIQKKLSVFFKEKYSE